jgi:GH18 family chitinase
MPTPPIPKTASFLFPLLISIHQPNTAAFAIEPTEVKDVTELYPQAVALKEANPDLKLLIAIGGWTMNNPGPYRTRFTEMVATKRNRTRFVNKAINFCATHGFDGLDLDWEYPGVASRGGRDTDKAGLVNLAKEFKTAAPDLLLAMAVAAGPFNWKGYDLPALEPYIDFFSLMTYDFHGSWESVTGLNTPWLEPSGSADIERALVHYIDTNGIPAEKINLGLAAYGRSWTLRNPDPLAGPGSQGSAGKRGVCTRESGYLGWREVREMIEVYGARVTIDTAAKAAYAVNLTDPSQWVSFDLPQTLYMKIQEARARGLGGLMVWEAALDDADDTVLNLVLNKDDPGAFVQPECGNGVIGNGECPLVTHCCSKSGQCGTAGSVCGSDVCVYGPCWDTPAPPATKRLRVEFPLPVPSGLASPCADFTNRSLQAYLDAGMGALDIKIYEMVGSCSASGHLNIRLTWKVDEANAAAGKRRLASLLRTGGLASVAVRSMGNMGRQRYWLMPRGRPVVKIL